MSTHTHFPEINKGPAVCGSGKWRPRYHPSSWDQMILVIKISTWVNHLATGRCNRRRGNIKYEVMFNNVRWTLAGISATDYSLSCFTERQHSDLHVLLRPVDVQHFVAHSWFRHSWITRTASKASLFPECSCPGALYQSHSCKRISTFSTCYFLYHVKRPQRHQAVFSVNNAIYIYIQSKKIM